MRYEHLNGTRSSPKITGHAKIMGHTHITRVSRYLDGIRSFFNAPLPLALPDIQHHRSVENLSRNRSISMTSRDMTSSSRDPELSRDPQEMWRARSLSYLGSMADTGTPLRSGSLVRFTASTESLSVMEVEGGDDEREGTKRMEDEGSRDVGEEITRSRNSSGYGPLRDPKRNQYIV